MADIKFAKQLNGYDTAQVDDYIVTLSDSYQHMHGEYHALCVKFNSLLADYTKLTSERRNDTQVLNKAMYDAELLYKQIVENARAESERIMVQVRQNVAATAQALAQSTHSVQDLLAAFTGEPVCSTQPIAVSYCHR